MRGISFDIVARRDDRLLIIKILSNVDAFSKENADEMSVLAEALGASPLLVGEKIWVRGDRREHRVFKVRHTDDIIDHPIGPSPRGSKSHRSSSRPPGGYMSNSTVSSSKR